MNDLDKTTFDRFAMRFTRIERQVPDPPTHAAVAGIARRARRRVSPIAGALGVAILVTATVGLAVIGSSPGPVPSPSAAAASLPSDTQVPIVFPTDGPQAHPVLGGNYWMITELDGVAVTGFAELGFDRRGDASGNFQFDCGSLAFDYAYDLNGSSISFTVDTEHSSTEGCTDAQLALYNAVQAALPRIAAWRSPEPEHLELLNAGGATVVRAGPLPPLPTAPPVGECGEVPLADCERAATLSFNFDLFPEPGQTVVSWRVRPSIYSSCASPGDPKYDVIFQLENPARESIATVTEFDGELHACGPY